MQIDVYSETQHEQSLLILCFVACWSVNESKQNFREFRDIKKVVSEANYSDKFVVRKVGRDPDGLKRILLILNHLKIMRKFKSLAKDFQP